MKEEAKIVYRVLFQETTLGDEVEGSVDVSKEDQDGLDIPGAPFLIASVCVVLAIISAYFVRDIRTAKIEAENKNSAEAGSSTNSSSESDSHTKVKIKSSVTDVREIVDQENTKSNSRKC